MSLRRRIMDILERGHLTAQQKLVGIILLIHANKEGVAWPSTATIQELASIKRNTVFEAAIALEREQIIERQMKGGQKTKYRFLPLKVVDEVIDAYEAQKAAREPVSQTDQSTSIPNGPVSQTDQYPKRTRPVSQTDQTSIPNGPAIRTLTELVNELEEVAALPPHVKPMEDFAQNHCDARWKPDGTIEVVNGFRAELLKSFPDVDLESGLAIVAGETGKGANLTAAIRRRFGYLQNDARVKARRYQANAPKRPRSL